MTDKVILPASGGSYMAHPDTGTLTQTEAPTADHPEGNRPRPAEEASVDAAQADLALKSRKGAK